MTCARARGLGVPRRRTTTGAPFPQPLRHPSPAACFSNLLCFCFCVGDHETRVSIQLSPLSFPTLSTHTHTLGTEL